MYIYIFNEIHILLFSLKIITTVRKPANKGSLALLFAGHHFAI